MASSTRNHPVEPEYAKNRDELKSRSSKQAEEGTYNGDQRRFEREKSIAENNFKMCKYRNNEMKRRNQKEKEQLMIAKDSLIAAALEKAKFAYFQYVLEHTKEWKEDQSFPIKKDEIIENVILNTSTITDNTSFNDTYQNTNVVDDTNLSDTDKNNEDDEVSHRSILIEDHSPTAAAAATRISTNHENNEHISDINNDTEIFDENNNEILVEPTNSEVIVIETKSSNTVMTNTSSKEEEEEPADEKEEDKEEEEEEVKEDKEEDVQEEEEEEEEEPADEKEEKEEEADAVVESNGISNIVENVGDNDNVTTTNRVVIVAAKGNRELVPNINEVVSSSSSSSSTTTISSPKQEVSEIAHNENKDKEENEETIVESLNAQVDTNNVLIDESESITQRGTQREITLQSTQSSNGSINSDEEFGISPQTSPSHNNKNEEKKQNDKAQKKTSSIMGKTNYLSYSDDEDDREDVHFNLMGGGLHTQSPFNSTMPSNIRNLGSMSGVSPLSGHSQPMVLGLGRNSFTSPK